jgi:hypothetical protein
MTQPDSLKQGNEPGETDNLSQAHLPQLPRRPAWAQSDPRWRWRILLGLWVVLCVPLVDLLKHTGAMAYIPAINLFGHRSGLDSMDDMLLGNMLEAESFIVFAIGLALLFSHEAGRQLYFFEWTRRMGIFGSCIHLVGALGCAALLPFLAGAGVVKTLLSMPLDLQPGMFEGLIFILTTFPWYLAYDSKWVLIHAATSYALVCLAAIWLFHAIRSAYGTLTASLLSAGMVGVVVTTLAMLAWAFVEQLLGVKDSLLLFEEMYPFMRGKLVIASVVGLDPNQTDDELPALLPWWVAHRDLILYLHFAVIAVLMTFAQVKAVAKKSIPTQSPASDRGVASVE